MRKKKDNWKKMNVKSQKYHVIFAISYSIKPDDYLKRFWGFCRFFLFMRINLYIIHEKEIWTNFFYTQRIFCKLFSIFRTYLLISNSVSLAINNFSTFHSILSRYMNTQNSDNKLVYWSKDNKQHIHEMTPETFWLNNTIK